MTSTIFDTRAGGVVKATARVGVRQFGVLTSRLRVLPDFVIIGTKRGGTTSMYYYLLQHPQVLPMFPPAHLFPMRENIKGVHYFDTGHRQGSAWYRSHFPFRATKEIARRRSGRDALVGEASPYYLFHPQAPRRARALIPDAKLIVLLRDPVERAYSHYKEQRRRGMEPLATFEEAITAEAGRLQGEAERLRRDDGYASFSHEHQSYVNQGKYLGPLQAWLELFPRSQMLILKSEDFYRYPQTAYEGVTDFLDLERHELAEPAPWNASNSSTLPEHVRRRLEDEFAEPDRALEEYLGRRFDWTRAGAGARS